MNTYKITTNTGFTNYLGASLTPDVFVKQMFNFDYDAYHLRCGNKPKWDLSNGVIIEIELFWSDEEQKQVRKILTN